jgi:hypothetical protein
MEKLAGLDEIIGPPYHYLTITDKGSASVLSAPGAPG